MDGSPEKLINSYLYKNQHSVRAEASKSIKELHQMLHSSSSDSELNKKQNLEPSSVFQEHLYSDTTYSVAACKLKTLINFEAKTFDDIIGTGSSDQNILFHHDMKNNINLETKENDQNTININDQRKHSSQNVLNFSDNEEYNKNSNILKTSGMRVPSHEELTTLLNQEKEQSLIYLQEINFLKEQNSKFKEFIDKLMIDNEKLNEDLNKKLIHELFENGSEFILERNKSSSRNEMSVSELNKHNVDQFDDEINNVNKNNLASDYANIIILNRSYASKMKMLKSQLEYMSLEKKDLEEELNRMREKVKILEEINKISNNTKEEVNADIASNLCANCLNVWQPENYSTFKEKQILFDEIELMKAKINELNQRESRLVDELKSNNRLVEQAQFEMSQAYIEKERLHEDLLKSKVMMKELVQSIDNCISKECADVEKGYLLKLNELNSMNKSFMDRLNEKEFMNEKLEKEKVKMQRDLEVLRNQIQSTDNGYFKLTENMKVNVIQTNLDHSMLHLQLERVKIELNQSENTRHTERIKSREEIDLLKNRVNEAESLLLQCKKNCIQLHLNNQSLVKKLEKNKLENSFKDTISIQNNRMESREQEYKKQLAETQFKYENVFKNLESYIRTYETYVKKLQHECKVLIDKFNTSTSTYKKVSSQLYEENVNLKRELNEALTKINEKLGCENISN